MKTPYGKLAKIYAKYFSHMTKMTAMTKYGKLLLQNQKACDIGTWYITLGCGTYQVNSNDDPKLTLTYITSDQICFHMHLNGIFF